METQIHLPFEQLTGLLQSQGFSIKPDDYIELLKVVEKTGAGNISGLKYRLAPLICTSEEEQERFYSLFDKYAQDIQQQDSEKERQRTRRRLWQYGAIVITALVAIFYFVPHDNTRPVVVPRAFFLISVNGSNIVEARGKNNLICAIPGDTAVLGTSAAITGLSDTTGITLSWNTGRGWTNINQRNVKLPLTRQGDYLIQLKVRSGENVAVDSQHIRVCSGIISSIITNKRDEDIRPGDEMTLEPKVRGNKHFMPSFQWIVNADTLTAAGAVLHYRFSNPGDYTITCAAYDTANASSPCAQEYHISLTIAKPVENVQLSVTAAGPPVVPVYRLNPWLWSLLLLPLAAAGMLYYRQQRRKQKTAAIKGSHSQAPVAAKPAAPPHDVPLENKAIELVARESDMNLLFREMRRRTEDEHQVLHISRSILAEIRSGGIPSLVFSNRLKQQEYLILIDSANVRSQQLKLFEYLTSLLSEQDICIEKFYYRTFDLFFNDAFPSGISLQRLMALYKEDVLIIFGNAYQLVYPAYPVLEKEKAALLHEWEYKAILTPVAYPDWNVREAAIKADFVLLPADIQGQLQLLQAIREKQLLHDRYLQSEGKLYAVAPFYLTDVNEIKRYLNDNILFQWVCAICVYPRLRWEIIIGIGKTICGRYNEPGRLNFTSLLKLVRISWMQTGSFPEQTRLELLKQLTVDNELAVRETLLELLQYPALYYTGSHFFEEEKNVQELTSKFILYASGNAKYSRYEPAYAQFKIRWENNTIPDGPLKRYLAKQPGDKWQTPILHQGSNVGVNEYFNSAQEASLRNSSRRFNRYYMAAAGVALLLTTLLLAGATWLKPLGNNFVAVDSSKMYPLSFTLKTDTCVNDPAAFAKGVTASITVNSNRYPLTFGAANKATVQLPYRDIAGMPGRVQLAWNNNRQSAGNLASFSDSNILVLKTCVTRQLTPLYVYYNTEARYDSIQQLVQVLKNYYDVLGVRVAPFVGSRMNIFSKEDMPRADSIVQLTKNTLKKDIPIYVLTENKNQREVPILFVFFSQATETPGSGSGLTAAQLPSGISEVWKGAANNRLVTIRLQSGLIYYSTGDAKTYGTYHVYAVYKNKQEAYKVVMQSDKGFSVWFIKNVKAQSFELSACETFFKSPEAWQQITESACNSYDMMTLYYPENKDVVYVPQNGVNFTAGEIKKLKDKIDNAKKSFLIFEPVQLNINTFFYTTAEMPGFLSLVSNALSGITGEGLMFRWGARNAFTGTPFERNYFELTIGKNQIPEAAKVVLTSEAILDATESTIRARADGLTAIIAQAMKRAAPQADVVIFNAGLIRCNCILKAPFTRYDIYNLLAFGGAIAEADLKGDLLLKTLAAGLKNKGTGGFLHYSANLEFDPGSGNWTLDKVNIMPDKVYRVAMPEFLLSGKEVNLDFLNTKSPSVIKVYPAVTSETDPRSDIRLAVTQYLEGSKGYDQK